MSIELDPFETLEKAMFFSERHQKDAYRSMFLDALKERKYKKLYELNEKSLGIFMQLIDCDRLFENQKDISPGLSGKRIWEVLSKDDE